MTEDSRAIEIQAAFAEPAEAEAAVLALVEIGIPRSSIDLRHGILPEARQREGRFVSRVLLLIALWSIAGALPGAAFGFLLAKTIGPERRSYRADRLLDDRRAPHRRHARRLFRPRRPHPG